MVRVYAPDCDCKDPHRAGPVLVLFNDADPDLPNDPEAAGFVSE